MASGNSLSKTAVWILMGLLILGLGGFGITNLSGTVRTVGSVGDTEITVEDYARALRDELAATEAEDGGRMSFTQAQADGLPDRVLAQLIAVAALEDETDRIGISVGDANLREEILNIRAFQGPGGEFNRDAYRFALEQAGLNEAQFEEDVRTETARTLLQGAVLAGVRAPDAYADTVLNYLGERRDISWVVLDRGDLSTGLPDPTEDDLRTYHQSHLPDFTTPETKSITYALLTPEMILDTVEVSEESLRDAYEAREAEFNQPERRLVERLVFPDEAAAEEARAALEAGETTFEDLVEARGLTLSDIDIGDVSRSELGDAGEAVFSTEPGEIAGPAPSPVGPALYRVNGVLTAQQTPFEEAEPMLRDELAQDRARRVIDDRIETIDDLLAGGATLEDLARDTDMELGQIDWHEGVSDGIGAYEDFRAAARTLSEGDYPEIETLEDGGIFAMRLDGVNEPRIQPVEEVRDRLTAAWRDDAVTRALRAEVEPQVDELASGTDFAELGYSDVETAQDITRQGFDAATPPQFIDAVFGMTEGDARLLDGEGRVFLIRLDKVSPPDTSSDDLATLRRLLANQAANSLSQDLFQALTTDIRMRAGVTIDQSALNAVHANFQ
ncbi:peptidyl-prolyl cis-trans isomerase [Roseovarius sp. SCSIO 43702]|uniref:peptidylprolyl isomerase n=1 Tax=Roseovarius sp. SCSIO 43702 TaxID=2823043 RepID=UPI001C72FBE4|nr:peptidylprolyl isomerase [Roseovarius sp. SCSIO 43702]QYX58372.1 peptidyl-prolyl cis-trans isomerase [Roseovarius sp. SCSIO 43702]